MSKIRLGAGTAVASTPLVRPPSVSARVLSTLRSMGVGVLATGLDVALLSTLVYGAKLDARLASPIALAAGVALQFVGNKLVAFRDRSPRWAGQAARFLAVEAAGFMANLALFDVAVRALPVPVPILRLATTAVVYFTVCLPLWARIFQAPAAPTLAE